MLHLRPALAYATLIFAAGFVLGAVRVLWVAPALGPFAAVALELPVMLTLSWVIAGRILRRWPVPRGGPRLALGILAFALLMAAELALARWGFGQGTTQVLQGYASLPGLLGLAGQIGFGLIPALRP
jgi:hypothetical protein